MLRIIITSLVLLTLSACVTQPRYIKNTQTLGTISKNDLSNGNGILTGTFSRQIKGRAYNFRALRFKNIETEEVYSIEKSTGVSFLEKNTKRHFSGKSMDGQVFAFTLPEGKYTIYDFSLFVNNGTTTRSWSSEQHFSIPFEVKAGKVNYLGAFHFTPFYGKNLLGFNIHDAGFWLVTDELERDKKHINSVYPNIPTNEMIKVIPSKKEIFTPVVVFPSELIRNAQSLQK